MRSYDESADDDVSWRPLTARSVEHCVSSSSPLVTTAYAQVAQKVNNASLSVCLPLAVIACLCYLSMNNVCSLSA